MNARYSTNRQKTVLLIGTYYEIYVLTLAMFYTQTNFKHIIPQSYKPNDFFFSLFFFFSIRYFPPLNQQELLLLTPCEISLSAPPVSFILAPPLLLCCHSW